MSDTIKPLISIIIPHFNGKEILSDCLISIQKNNYKNIEILVVDNGSTDGSQQMLRKDFAAVRLIQNNENKGYAGGCNTGIINSNGEIVFLLNNDTVLAPDVISRMEQMFNADQSTGIVQPKIRSIQKKENFDYSGGAGGELDIFGYPVVRGRLVDNIEKDDGQYDKSNREIFWATGTACMIRKSIFNEIGVLDEDFFAHMEEIDLNWRAHLAGYKSAVCTETYLYHYSGYTLSAASSQKMYLNHRNSMVMILKNYSFASLSWILPIRLIMELSTILFALIKGNFPWAAAVIKSLWYLTKNIKNIFRKHSDIQKIRKKSDKEIMFIMLRGSVPWSHFILRKSSYDLIKKMKKINR